MKLIQTLVSSQGFREQATNDVRTTLLRKLTLLCAGKGGRLLLIPAGYLTSGSEEGVTELVGEVRRIAGGAGVAVIGGVDVTGTASKRSLSIEKAVRECRLGYFGFAVGRGVLPADGSLWRQTSIDNVNADCVPEDAVPGGDRVVMIDGTRVAVLICGELFSWRARAGVGSTGAGLVVDVGHTGMGQGLIPAMKSVASQGRCPVAHSQHLKSWCGRSLHFVDSRGAQQSVAVDEDHVVEHGSLWSAWREREV